MLARGESSSAAILSKHAPRMDCRIKSGNYEIEIRSRDACARVLHTTTPEEICSRRQKGGEAPKGACANHSAQQRRMSPFAEPLARLRAAFGGAPAFRRFTAALTTGYYPDGSAPEPGFRKARRAGVLPVRRTTLCVKHLRADRSFCRPTGAPGPPGSGSHSHPRAGTASRRRLPKVPSRKAPLVRGDFGIVT
jgi:hypothetical protein